MTTNETPLQNGFTKKTDALIKLIDKVGFPAVLNLILLYIIYNQFSILSNSLQQIMLQLQKISMLLTK